MVDSQQNMIDPFIITHKYASNIAHKKFQIDPIHNLKKLAVGLFHFSAKYWSYMGIVPESTHPLSVQLLVTV